MRRVSRQVLAEVGLRRRVDLLEDGIDTILEKNGDELSAGERQRLCIARALFRNAPFLMLDEPTAHLDPPSAEALVRTLQGLLAGRTVVWVTHDERLARISDRIIVVRDGQVVAQGPGPTVRATKMYRQVFEEAPQETFIRAAT